MKTDISMFFIHLSAHLQQTTFENTAAKGEIAHDEYNEWIEMKTFKHMEKLLIMNNFSICHNVFKSFLLKDASKC